MMPLRILPLIAEWIKFGSSLHYDHVQALRIQEAVLSAINLHGFAKNCTIRL